MAYLKKKQPEGCIFCNAWEKREGLATLCFYKGKNTLIMLNRFPYTNGHLMVVPKNHTGKLEEIGEENLNELMETIIKAKVLLRKVYRPHGFNIGLNEGTCAGAGFKDHIHFHIVPRWEGDTNFMTTISNTRMIPQDLKETFKILKNTLKELK
ncbi:MAG: HIT domain-containing protein [Thermoanaerobaculia bacterium]